MSSFSVLATGLSALSPLDEVCLFYLESYPGGVINPAGSDHSSIATEKQYTWLWSALVKEYPGGVINPAGSDHSSIATEMQYTWLWSALVKESEKT